jgi:hypothetical protein
MSTDLTEIFCSNETQKRAPIKNLSYREIAIVSAIKLEERIYRKNSKMIWDLVVILETGEAQKAGYALIRHGLLQQCLFQKEHQSLYHSNVL